MDTDLDRKTYQKSNADDIMTEIILQLVTHRPNNIVEFVHEFTGKKLRNEDVSMPYMTNSLRESMPTMVYENDLQKLGPPRQDLENNTDVNRDNTIAPTTNSLTVQLQNEKNYTIKGSHINIPQHEQSDDDYESRLISEDQRSEIRNEFKNKLNSLKDILYKKQALSKDEEQKLETMLNLECQKKYGVDSWIDFKDLKQYPNQILALKDLPILKGKVSPDELSSEEKAVTKEALADFRKFKKLKTIISDDDKHKIGAKKRWHDIDDSVKNEIESRYSELRRDFTFASKSEPKYAKFLTRLCRYYDKDGNIKETTKRIARYPNNTEWEIPIMLEDDSPNKMLGWKICPKQLFGQPHDNIYRNIDSKTSIMNEISCHGCEMTYSPITRARTYCAAKMEELKLPEFDVFYEETKAIIIKDDLESNALNFERDNEKWSPETRTAMESNNKKNLVFFIRFTGRHDDRWPKLFQSSSRFLTNRPYCFECFREFCFEVGGKKQYQRIIELLRLKTYYYVMNRNEFTQNSNVLKNIGPLE